MCGKINSINNGSFGGIQVSEKLYTELQKAFADIRFNQNMDEAQNTLKQAKKELRKSKYSEDNSLIIYCIDTMFDILNEKMPEKIYDFADLVHNIPEIPMGKRNFYSLNSDIEAFRSKYGERYFIDFGKVKPRFNKRAPKNIWAYFLPNSDDEFKARHPKAYFWLRILGVLALFIPQICFVAVVFFVFLTETCTNAFVLIGYIGSFMVGVGLFNIVAAFVHQYLGHKLTVICIFGGGLLVAVSLFAVFNPHIFPDIDIDIFLHYVLNLIWLPLLAGYYYLFRCGVTSLLESKKIRRSTLNKLKKGAKNFWWYEALQAEYNLGMIYYLNKIFTIAFSVLSFSMITFGFIKFMLIPNMVLYGILCVLGSAMSIFESVQRNLAKYGKPFVLLENCGHGLRHADSVVHDIIRAAVPLLFAFVEYKVVTGFIL